MGTLVNELVERSRKAQAVLETYSQEKIDEIVKMFAKVVYDNAEELAQLAIDETRMGVYTDKVAKCQGKSRAIWNALKGKKSTGILNVDEEAGIIEVAKPMGVVAAATPCTNPVVTPMCNGMYAVKCKNTIIIAPHPRGKKCAKAVASVYSICTQRTSSQMLAQLPTTAGYWPSSLIFLKLSFPISTWRY